MILHVNSLLRYYPGSDYCGEVNPAHLPRPEVSAVLFDIDQTLTHHNGASNVGPEKPGSPAFQVFPEVARTIRALHAAGFDLYTATTNAAVAASAKLALAGLAAHGASPYFKGLLGGSELSPEGKTSPVFFRDLLRHYELDPEQVAHVGDDPVRDVCFARQAGIRWVIQIDRTQSEPVRALEPSGLAIQRLDLLIDLLKLKQ